MAHKTIKVVVGKNNADIDAKIAPLIKRLWELDIDTINSCQNNFPRNYVWIEFLCSTDAERFLNIVASYNEDPNSLYNRIRHEWDVPNQKDFWIYSVHPYDLGVSQEFDDDDNSIEEYFDGEHKFIFMVSIRFPQRDLPAVIKKLNEYVPPEKISINTIMVDGPRDIN